MIASIKKALNRAKLKDKNYEYLLSESMSSDVVCFDCETTGLNPKKDDIISIGAIKIRENKILLSEKFEVLVKSQKNLDENSIKIHQIRVCDLDMARDIESALEEFLEFIGNLPLVGYHLNFDVEMIDKYLKPKIGIGLPNRQIEVATLYHNKLINKNPYVGVDMRFDTILKELDIPILGKHDAINDAIMTAMIYIKLKQK